MNSLPSRVFVAAWLGLLVCVVAGPAVVAAELAPNPSFETSENKVDPDGWVRHPMGQKATWVKGIAKQGEHSVEIASSGKNGAFWMTEEMIAIEAGQSYLLTGWIKTENAWGDNQIKIAWYDKNGKWMKTAFSEAVNGTKDWTKISLEAVAPDNARMARLMVGRRHPAGDAKAWFDEVSFTLQNATQGLSEAADNGSPNWAATSSAQQARWQPMQQGETLAELIRLPGVSRELPVAASGWQKVGERFGTLTQDADLLTIASTNDRAVGWASSPFNVQGQRQLLLATHVVRNGSYNLHLAIRWLDASGQQLNLEQFKAPNELLTRHGLLTARTPVPTGAHAAQIAIFQSRSNGSTQISQLVCYGQQ